MKRVLEKMAIALKEKDNNYSLFLVIGIYKIKNKKVQLINTNNRTRKGPSKYPYQFKKSKTREYIQKYTRKYKNYLLLRILAIPRDSRLIPECLK